jgi:hypothetical protein
MSLVIAPNLTDPDAAYAALLAAHKGLAEVESNALNARLVLILMNHLGDGPAFAQALQLARGAA